MCNICIWKLILDYVYNIYFGSIFKSEPIFNQIVLDMLGYYNNNITLNVM